MRPSKIKAKLARREPVLVTSLALTDASLFELASLMGFDGIWLDLEHHAHSVETAATLMRAARVGTADVMARPAKGEFMRLARLLEAGANGIMYPRCDNAQEARELVTWSKFHPKGKRGIDSANADNPYCMMPLAPYVEYANEQTFLVAQIEDPAALEHVEEIAAVDGIDVLFFGPGDFGVLSGIPGQSAHPSSLPRSSESPPRPSAPARPGACQARRSSGPRNCSTWGHASLPTGPTSSWSKPGSKRSKTSSPALGFTFDRSL